MSIYNSIKVKKPKKSVFNLSYSSKLSLDFGRLYPIYCEKVVPGDKFKHQQQFFLRFAPFVNQVFQEFEVHTEYFYVPSRLIWKDFEQFISSSEQDILHPFLDYSSLLNKNSLETSLFDYFGLPTHISNPDGLTPSINKDIHIDVLPFYAYLKIYLDYYIDENLLPDFLLNFDFSDDIQGNNNDYFKSFYNLFRSLTENINLEEDNTFLPLYRLYPKDYFTSALPTAQMGAPVTIPLDGSGDVIINSSNSGASVRYQNVALDYNANDGTVTLYGNKESVDSNEVVESPSPGYGTLSFKVNSINNVATIQDLRTAVAIAQFLEKRGYAGHRYKEIIKSSFGVNSRDSRLDRPELLQTNRNLVQLGDVFTTSFDNDNSVPGMGVSTSKSMSQTKYFTKFCEEHGYIIGLMSVFPKAGYFQGVPKQFLELDQFEYYFPEFQHIGEQEIENIELNIYNSKRETFGYTPRYAQYKSRTNQVHGNFRNSLKFMQDSRDFGYHTPVLNHAFLSINPTSNNLYRVFNANSALAQSQPIYVDLFHKVKALRPMSYYGLPRFTN